MENNDFQNADNGQTTTQTPYVTYVPYGYTLNTYNEKRKIRNTAFMCGIAFIIAMFLMQASSYIYLFVAKKLGFTATQAWNFISDPAVMQVFQIVVSGLVFTLPFIIVFKCFGRNISSLVPLGRPQGENKLSLFLIGVAFCAFANISVSYAGSFFEFFGVNYEVNYGEDPKGFFGFILSVISTVIMPALVEEFACRGLVLGSLRRFGDGFALIISSALFGLMHGNFEQIPFAFMVGLVLGFIVIKSGSLWIAVTVHGFNNLVSVIFSYLPKSIPNEVQNSCYSFFLMLCLLFGIAAMFKLCENKEFFKFENANTESTFKQKLKWFFTFPLTVIFVIFCFAESLIYFF